MRRILPLATAILATSLTGLSPAPSLAEPTSSTGARAPSSTDQRQRPADDMAAPYDEVAADLDLTSVVPALQQAFGDRYGGYWFEVRERDDVMHVAVVGATARDRATVARLTGRHPRVVTDAVEHGYDELLAAQDEIALSRDPEAGDFTVGVDVATNSVVVTTEQADTAAVAADARQAARRGPARHARERAGAPPRIDPGGSARVRAPRGPSATTAPASPGDDLATAVTIEPRAAIDIAPVADRNTFPPYEGGLSTRIVVGNRINGCTTGLLFVNGFGRFASTAGHCGRVGDGVVIGPRIVDVIRANGYHGYPWVMADASLVSLSARGWASWPEIRAGAGGRDHRGVTGKYRNAQITTGLRLCFEGVASDSGNCGNVVRANQWMCCDAAGHEFYYSCINFPSRPGDSGAPVFRPTTYPRAIAAGMVSSSVTVGGTTMTCFSTVESMEYILGSRLVMW